MGSLRHIVALLLCATLLPSVGGQAREPAPVPSLGVINVANLPQEARETLRLIKAGGPFPYSRDGIFFQNRERLLPTKPRNYYREYTVPTPGSRDRGARRIIVGQDARQYYYTHDHYRSFRQIVE